MRKILFLVPICLAATAGVVAATAVPASQGAVPARAEPAAEVAPSPARLKLSTELAAQGVEKNLMPRGVKTLLKVPRTLEHGDYVWDDEGVPAGKLAIFVDMRRQMVSVFRGGHEIGTAVIVYGGNGHESPTGRFPILRMHRDYHSRSYDAPMPYTMFVTNDGVALHGSPMAADRATHGCIGLPISFARLLFEQAAKGDVVEIVRSDPV